MPSIFLHFGGALSLANNAFSGEVSKELGSLGTYLQLGGLGRLDLLLK
jgi:hypothetical protein